MYFVKNLLNFVCKSKISCINSQNLITNLLKIGKFNYFCLNYVKLDFSKFQPKLDMNLPNSGKILENCVGIVKCKIFPNFGKSYTFGYPKT